jgi:hypothetical protein
MVFSRNVGSRVGGAAFRQRASVAMWCKMQAGFLRSGESAFVASPGRGVLRGSAIKPGCRRNAPRSEPVSNRGSVGRSLAVKCGANSFGGYSGVWPSNNRMHATRSLRSLLDGRLEFGVVVVSSWFQTDRASRARDAGRWTPLFADKFNPE